MGIWLLSLSLFVAVKRWSSALPALCAAAFPLITTAYPYSYEGRAYGLMMGFGGLAFLAWQSATLRSGGTRTLSLVGLCASLALTMTSHYYGVFVLVPIAAGEIARYWTHHRIDWSVWAALALSPLPLLWHLELVRSGAEYSGAFWSPPQWVNLPDFYSDLLSPAVVPAVVLLLAGTVAALALEDRRAPAAIDTTYLPPRHEVIAALGYVAIPAICVVVAKLVTGAFVNRYALLAVVGFSFLAGCGTALWFRRWPSLRLFAAVCVVGWFGLTQAREMIEPTGVSMPMSRQRIDRQAAWVQDAGEPSLPVVVADAHSFAVLSHYAAPEMRSRIVYLADPALALKRLGHNSIERGMLDLLKPWFGMHVVPFEPWLSEHERFLVYGDFWRLNFLNWLAPELQARGVTLELLNRAGDDMLLLATRPGARQTAPDGATAAR
jgi:hypothetical protein